MLKMKNNRGRKKVADLNGKIKIGGYPIVIQSMTKTKTADVKATIEQTRALFNAGCEAVRITVNNEEERETIRSELEQYARQVNPKCKVFCSRACANLYGELFGDWSNWSEVTRIKNAENREKIIKRIKKALYYV